MVASVNTVALMQHKNKKLFLKYKIMDGAARVRVYLEMKSSQFKTALNEAKNRLNGTVQELKGKLSSLKAKHIETFEAMKGEVPGLGRAVELITNPFVVLGAAIAAVGVAFKKASVMAQEFDKYVAKANTTAQESPEQLAKTKNILGGMAAKSTLENAHQYAPQAYDIMLSSGMNKDIALKSVPDILKAAKATSTDPATVARALSGVMNSTGEKDSSVIMDKMAMIKNKGNAEFEDIANYFPKIIPAANNAGVAINDVGGAFAYLTSMGFKSEQAATGLENVFKTLADPQKAAAFKQIGVDFYDSTGKMRPMLSVVNDLKTALGGLTDEQKTKVLGSLGLDTESASTLSAMTTDIDKLKGSIDGVSNASGEMGRQFEAAKTPMDGWTKVSNTINEAWRRVGEAINTIILGPLGTFFSNLFEGILNGTSTISPFLESIKNTFMNIYTIVAEALSPVFDFIGSLISTIYNYIISIATSTWSIIEPITAWFAKSELLKDMFWLIGELLKGIGWIIGKIGEALGWTFNKLGEGILWVYDHTIKPILDAIEWIYTKIKSILGLKTNDSNVNKAKEVLKDISPNTPESPKKQDNLLKPSPKVDALLNSKGNPPGGGGGGGKGSKDTGGMNGQSNTRVININKLSVVDGNFISASPEVSGMGKAELEAWFEQMITRAMVNLGRSYN